MIFVDTSFWIALAIAADSRHAIAVELVQRHAATPLTTSNLVCGEVWTFTRRRFGHARAVRLVDELERSPRVDILRVDPDEEVEAWSWLRRRDEREYSFVDATSFAFMRRRRIAEAFAFDGDFAAAGFAELRP